jgi:outer membrane lipoprotein-sorting protein
VTRLARFARWLVPLGVIALVAVSAWGWRTATAPGAARVAPLDAANVADLAQRTQTTPHSGVFELVTHLGLGDFTGSVSGNQLASLLSGTNVARVWTDGPTRSRVALLQPLQETDWVRNGTSTWVWQSTGQQAARVALPVIAQIPPLGVVTSLVGGSSVQTPDEVANTFLAWRGQSTLSLAPPDHVAGRRAYELVLSPKSRVSLIAHVRIAVDAETGLVLRTTVGVVGGGAPAIDAHYTSISYSRPAVSNFTFNPPPHAVIVSAPTLGAAEASPFAGDQPVVRARHRHDRFRDGGDRGFDTPTSFKLVGSGWDQVVVASGLRGWQFSELLGNTSNVSGSFGSGRLTKTPVATIIALYDGRVAAGAVTPAGVEAALAQSPPSN